MTHNTDHEKVHAFLREGVRHHQRGELEAAGACYAKVLRLCPDHPDALHLSGVLAYQRGDAERAVVLIQRAVEKDATHPLFHYNLGNAFRESGRLDEAFSAYQTALKLNPNYAEALYGMGNVLTARGDIPGAMSAYQKAVALNPHMAEAVFCMGNLCRENGDLPQAVTLYEKAVAIDTQLIHAHLELGNTLLELEELDEAIERFSLVADRADDPSEVYFCIGNAHLEKKAYEAAIQSYGQALKHNGQHAKAHINRGLALRRLDRFDAAESAYRSGIAAAPDSADGYYNLGNLLDTMGRRSEAIGAYETALEKSPDHLKALYNLGGVHAALNQWTASLACYEKALALKPDYPECLHRMGIALLRQGDPQTAIGCFTRALEIRPDMPQVHNSMGNAMKEAHRQPEAESFYRKALDLDPGFYEAWNNLGMVYKEQGRIQKAIQCFNRMLSIKPDFGVEVKKAMMLPLFYKDVEEMNAVRARFAGRLERLIQRPGKLSDPYRQVGMTNHNLALHGRNEREIREKIARFYLKACPDLAWCAPDLERPPLDGRKIRIGMVTRYFYNHTIGNLYAGIIKHLSREKFHVTVFRIPGKTDHLSEQIDRDADEVVMLPADLPSAREKIAGHQLDILFFLEIGMDAWTYFLAFSRMAPVQIKRGFPVTSGIPAVDYFISSDHFEPPDAQDHYSEKLIRLNRSGYCYPRPLVQGTRVDRAAYGIPESGHLYACLQSLFKFHPDFDPVLAGILRKDPQGYLLVLGGLHDNWKLRWLDRFNTAHADVSDRIIFLPQLGRDDFIAMFVIADAVLDTIHFCGGNTTLECFANGVPVVTWPSPYMRGRLSAGFYHMMDMDECVAKDLDAYVDIAVRLATDKVWQASVKRRLAERSHVLFEDMKSVRELEAVFETLVRKQ